VAARRVKKDQGINLGNDKMAIQRLKEAAEKAKTRGPRRMRRTSTCHSSPDAAGPKHVNVRLTRPKLKQARRRMIQR